MTDNSQERATDGGVKPPDPDKEAQVPPEPDKEAQVPPDPDKAVAPPESEKAVVPPEPERRRWWSRLIPKRRQ
jgi:hypothetical protein